MPDDQHNRSLLLGKFFNQITRIKHISHSLEYTISKLQMKWRKQLIYLVRMSGKARRKDEFRYFSFKSRNRREKSKEQEKDQSLPVLWVWHTHTHTHTHSLSLSHTHSPTLTHMHPTYPLHQFDEAQRLLQGRQVQPKSGHHDCASAPKNPLSSCC